MTTIVHKPTVVLADDYARVLEEVSGLLEDEIQYWWELTMEKTLCGP
jgi:hypothetical protein